ncbi:cytochrome b [Microvirga lenta]|uniref:cytochrome b n=1 Tax=Microvirga lenta TaxID=2881337 RepID=UPI001D000686|nr:cytochrome b/b6 domain-containing protein [Microvirga lenta]MCB5174972.1 cytochrome b/b6 domain-containing protein [Microvirga lenta]
MTLKSTSDRYGTVALALHWASAVLILILIPLGFAMQAVPDGLRPGLYRVHVASGIMVGLLTLVRLVWWRAFDLMSRPGQADASVQHRLARLVHAGFYGVVLALTVSGVGLIVRSGLAPMLAAGDLSSMSDLMRQPPRLAHGFMARLLLALLVLHIAGALYHHWIRRDGVLGRMLPLNAPRPSSARRGLPRRAAP